MLSEESFDVIMNISFVIITNYRRSLFRLQFPSVCSFTMQRSYSSVLIIFNYFFFMATHHNVTLKELGLYKEAVGNAGEGLKSLWNCEMKEVASCLCLK